MQKQLLVEVPEQLRDDQDGSEVCGILSFATKEAEERQTSLAAKEHRIECVARGGGNYNAGSVNVGVLPVMERRW